jgi:hypothetical protein
MMTNTIALLIVSPTFDIPTSLSAIAANDLTTFLKAHNIQFEAMFGLLPGRFYFETYLKTHPNIQAIFYLGHGSEQKLYGSEIFWAMLDTENDSILKDKIVFTMACLSSVELGPDAIKKGCKAYFGHTVLYNAAYSDESHDFLGDWIDYVTHVPKMLAQGATCGSAFAAYKSKLAGYVNMYKTFAEDPAKYGNADWVYTTAKSNLDNAQLLGDLNARISLPAPNTEGFAP